MKITGEVWSVTFTVTFHPRFMRKGDEEAVHETIEVSAPGSSGAR